MTKKKPSPQNRIWEKERRDRLNQTFDSLSKRLPEYEPATQLSKIEILQRTIEYVEKLEDKIKASLEERDALLKRHVDELEERLQVLIARNEDLAALLKKANINVPPCKHAATEAKDTPDEKRDTSFPEEVKPAGKSTKKSSSKKKVAEDTSEKSEEQHHVSTCTDSVIKSTAVSADEVSSSVDLSNVAGTVGAMPVAAPAVVASIPSTCLVMANNQIVGTLKQTSGVNVTSALLSTPIMATGVLISNNGSVLQMPIVPPSSSLLIVSNGDVRSKICMKKTRATSSAKKKVTRKGKFTIKSIDVIPGRIVNGKIPIPPLKRPPLLPVKKVRKEGRKKRVKRKVELVAQHEEIDQCESKKAKLNDSVKAVEICTIQETESKMAPHESVEANQSLNNRNQSIEEEVNQIEEQANSLDMNLDQGDLSADIFANLQVPDDVSGNNQGSLSPTAAYLMNFPLVATGGKASGIQVDAPLDGEVADDTEGDKKILPQQNNDNNLLLDNFSSYFTPNAYGVLDNPLQANPEPTVSSVVTSTNFSTIYQSIDSMLDHKPSKPVDNSDCKYSTTPFTFTLTSTSAKFTTQSSYDYRHSTSSSYFYGTTTTTTKPIDEYCLLKAPIVSEFTFSLTSTTPSAPKTVQSQYTNSIICSSTVTTPSYSTYGLTPKNSSKVASYNSNYIPESETRTPKKYDFLETEKPATSFTFSLTSSTKTLPKYTYPSNAVTSTAPTIQHAISTLSSSCSKVEDCLYRTNKLTSLGHAPYKTPPKQKTHPFPAVTSAHTTFQTHNNAQSQSKYDISWMASQNPKPVTNQEYGQVIPPLDFNPAQTHTYQTNFDLSRKSDIFFAHPSGEDNLASWSPNKLTNILNDTSSSYYPSTASTLPNLNGDLALNIIPSCQPTSAKNTTQQKVNDSGSTFLSVQQLVDQPRKNTTKSYSNSCANFTSNHKPLNNNYSAEALIAAPSTNSTKKDKYINDFSYNNYNAYNNEQGSGGTSIALNFDYSTDYNKNYNYSCQQNYMPSLIENSYNLPTLPAPVVTATTSIATYSSYVNTSSEKKQSSSYYQNVNYQTGHPSDIPYYVPSSEKRSHNHHQQTSSTAPMNKSRKHHVKPPPSNEYSSTLPTVSSTSSSYFPTIIPTPSSMADDPLCFNTFGFNPASTTVKSSAPSRSFNQAYPNYSFGNGNQSYPTNSNHPTASGGNSLTNFNLSSICPEINEKSGGSGSSTAGPTRHAIAGGSCW